MEANFSQSKRRNAFKHTFSTKNEMLKFISNFDYNCMYNLQTPPHPKLSNLFMQEEDGEELNRTVQSTVLFIGTSKLLSI